MELEGKLETLKRLGLNAVSLSYDAPPALKHVAGRLALSFPLLSDPDSSFLRRLNAINPRTDSAAYGGTILVDEHGVVRSKFFEEQIRERWSLASILLLEGEAPEGAREVRSDHFVVRTSASSLRVAPQQRVTLVLDFVVAPGHHLYAPGPHRYRALSLRLKPHDLVRLYDTKFPTPRSYYYKPLEETVPTFEGQFRVTRDITFEWGRPMHEFLKNPTHAITVEGDLEYQVCSDRVCYPPARVPVTWTIDVLPFDEGRVPEALRRKGAPR